jgi:hypothetical protein
VGLTPSVTPIRRLAFNFDLNPQDPNRAARLLGKSLASLSELKTHRSFCLDVTFKFSEVDQKADQMGCRLPTVYSLAVATEAIELVVADSGGRNEARVTVLLEHYLLNLIELKDMLGRQSRNNGSTLWTLY